MALPRVTVIPIAGKAVLLLMLQAAICVGGLGFQLVQGSNLPDSRFLSVALTALLVWSVASWKLAGRPLFDPYCIFLAAAFLFNGGHALLEVFGSNDPGMLNDLFSEEIVRQTLVHSFVGIAALHLGAMLMVNVTNRTAPIRWQSPSQVQWLRRVGWILLAIAIPPAAIWLMQSLAIVSVSGYASLYDREFQAGISATPLVLSGFLVPGALFLTASGRTYTADRRLAAGIIVTFAVLQFYIGYRSTAAMPLIAWLWLRHKLVAPVRGSVLLAWSLALVFLVFPLVRETRNLSGTDRAAGSLWETFASVDNPAVSSIHEMGSSMATTAHTLTLVPDSRPFDDGAGYLYAVLTLVPNMFWDLHPSVARGTASDWLVRAIDPWLAARGGAYGYSFIAEAYLNFGSFGVLPVMAIYGMLLLWLIRWAERSGDPAKLALVAVVLTFVLRLPRDELQGVLRPIVWQGILPYLAVVALPAILAGAVRSKTVRLLRQVPQS